MAARSTSSPATVTVKAPAAGTEPVSSAPSKVTVSVAPSTDAEEYVGGVLLVTDRPAMPATSLPDRSRSGVAPAPVGLA